jgi:hypothetical protein
MTGRWIVPRLAGLALLVGGLLLPTPARLSADVILDWNGLMLDAIRAEDESPPHAARSLAILHVAMFDAVNGVLQDYQPYFVDAHAPAETSAEAAAVGAAYQVMSSLYPTLQPRSDALYQSFRSNAPAGEARDQDLQLGESIAGMVLDWRAADGATTLVPYIPVAEPGHWQRTPPDYRPPDSPQCPFVTPFALLTGSQFRVPPPPALTSRQYADDVNQVEQLGAADSAARTADQTQVALFWSDFNYTETPPGHWNDIAAVVARQQGNSLAQNARLFALLNITLADAAIVAWDAKYTYDFWRPITAIREADTDGNPDTLPDPNWNSLLEAPPFPEYVSAHSVFGRAAATILDEFYGRDDIAFTIGNDRLPGITRSFQGFSQAADECGISRIYGGIHFMTSNRLGQTAGAALADYVSANLLLPRPALPRLALVSDFDGQQHLILDGLLGQHYVVGVSPDLRSWLPLSTNAMPAVGPAVIHAFSTNASRQFFRARLVP